MFMTGVLCTVCGAQVYFFISWRIIIKLIQSKLLFPWYTFTFNVVITHEMIITFQDICMDKIPKDFMSIKDTYYAALRFLFKHILSLFQASEYFIKA